MKKRVILSIIITGTIVGLTSQLWLFREPVNVTFNAEGTGLTSFEIVLNKKDDELFSRNNKAKIEVNLDNISEITIPVYKAKHPKRFQIIASQEFPVRGGGLVLSNIKVNGHLLDLTQFYTNSSNVKINENSIFISELKEIAQIFSKERLTIIPKIIFDIRILTIILILSYLLTYKLTSYLADFKNLKNQSRIEIIFLTAFFILLTLPCLKINDDIISKAENRTLSPYVPFINKSGINYNFGQDFNNWISDRFLGRSTLTRLYNKLHFMLTYYIYEQNDRFYNKKTGWAFTKGWINPSYSEKELSDYEKNILELKNFCDKHNIKLYVLIPPVKGEVYYNEIYPHITKPSNIDILEKNVNKKVSHNIIYYPLKSLRTASKKDYTYTQGDIHWSEYGAFITYKDLMQNIHNDFKEIKLPDENDYIITKKQLGKQDIYFEVFDKGCEYNTLGIDISEKSPEYLTYTHKQYNYLIQNNNDKTADLDAYFPFGNNKKVYIIGTSFSEKLFMFLRYSFIYTKKRAINGNKFKLSRWEKEILEFKPDIMIIVIQSSGIKAFSELFGGGE